MNRDIPADSKAISEGFYVILKFALKAQVLEAAGVSLK